MEEVLELLHAKDTKERMAGVERLQSLLEQSRKSLSASEVASLVEASLVLLKDNNFRVCQGTLQALASAAALASEQLKLYLNSLLPAIVERLGDGKQPVRDAARRLLLALMEISSPTIIVERAGTYAWSHKNWRIREEFARTVASAINLFAATELPFQRLLLPSVLQLLEDSNHNTREAAIICLEEMYRQGGAQLLDELQRHSLRPAQLKDINLRLEKIAPKMGGGAHLDGFTTQVSAADLKPAATNLSTGVVRRGSPKAKPAVVDNFEAAGENELTEKLAEPIKVYSEKELTREVEKVAGILIPEQDWSARIAAMQRIEGLVYGGAAQFACFPSLLKQLVGPLSLQLSDRRSSIVKQTCHLLGLLSKELLSDFEACAEAFIPMLFKLVVITVLVIAESADTCIKTMLRNCRVARVLPRIVDCAKNDRSSVLRSRCCEYAHLVLEQWAESPEIQRYADLYEDLIKCCVADAISEVRSTARTCYRVFAKHWPERCRRLFPSLDPVAQRLINEEEGGMHKRYTSPSIRERSANQVRQSTASLTAGIQSSVAGRQLSSYGDSTATSDRSVGSGSYQKIHAPTLATRVAIDSPSARDPPIPASLTSLHSSVAKAGVAPAQLKGITARNPASMQVPTDVTRGNFALSGGASDAKRMPLTAERLYQNRLNDDTTDELNMPKRTSKFGFQIEKSVGDTTYRDSSSLQSSIPSFRRPLMKTIRSSVNRSITDESQMPPMGEMYTYMDGLMSLNDALTEGLSANADWSARIAAFTFLKKLLQQGPRGIQEITQCFDKVIKLFSQHLEDPHHKVAQAALSTLADLLPACRKSFDGYLERILPHVFSRLVDPKPMIRHVCSPVLDIISTSFSVDSLLPALLRSLDEARSPKAKIAVIEFAVSSFARLAQHGETPTGNNFLRLWIAKLVPLANDKNAKLKETAVTGIFSVYAHVDSATVIDFILGMTMDEQSTLRRALKQFTPRIEMDLMNYFQNRNQKTRSKTIPDQSDALILSAEEGNGVSTGRASFSSGLYRSGSVNSDTTKRWSSGHLEELKLSGNKSVDEKHKIYYQAVNSADDPELPSARGIENDEVKSPHRSRSWSDQGLSTAHTGSESSNDNAKADCSQLVDQLTLNNRDATKPGHSFATELDGKRKAEKPSKPKEVGKASPLKTTPAIPVLLNQLSIGNDVGCTNRKLEALNEFMQISRTNDKTIWFQYLNQILNELLEVLDDPEAEVRELALSTVLEMLSNQSEMLEDSVELLLEKSIHSARDVVLKVSSTANRCLTTVLTQYDPYRCLSVVVPLLVSEDEKTLVTCIGSLTKLVGRLPPEELMAQLPSFLPAVFDAFGNPSADVRKTVVFCLVDIYIVLGKSFLPYLGNLSSTQLRLVTIYANRISQARSGAPLDSVSP